MCCTICPLCLRICVALSLVCRCVADHCIFAWGDNSQGQLALGDDDSSLMDRFTPSVVCESSLWAEKEFVRLYRSSDAMFVLVGRDPRHSSQPAPASQPVPA